MERSLVASIVLIASVACVYSQGDSWRLLSERRELERANREEPQYRSCPRPMEDWGNGGPEVKHGDPIRSKWKCKTCICNDGKVECGKENICSALEDPNRCVVDNIAYKSDTILSAFGCTKCICQDKKLLCDSESCNSQKEKRSQIHLSRRAGCEEGGRVYKDGEKFKIDCNTCFCHHGAAICTEVFCPGSFSTEENGGNWASRQLRDILFDGQMLSEQGQEKRSESENGCEHKGVNYDHLETFKDDCNSCSCYKGNVYCGYKDCSLFDN